MTFTTFSNVQLLSYAKTIRHRLDYNHSLISELLASIKELDSRKVNTQELKSGVYSVNWNRYEVENAAKP